MGYWTASGELLKESVLPLVFSLFSLVVFIVLGVLLIWRSDWFVGLILPTAGVASPDAGEPKRLQAVLFSVVGVVLVVIALPTIIFTIVAYAVEDPEMRTRIEWARLASLGVQLLLGVALFLGSTGLTRVWRRINEMNRAP
jgi:hypothetical protein